MLACPNCRTRLTKQPSPDGPRWLCGACRGRAVHLPSLRCTPAGAFVRRLWALAHSAPRNEQWRPCPICGDLMPVVPSIAAPGSNEPLQLDVCVSCQFVWFDPTEHEAWLRASSLAATDGRLPAETRAALARLPQPPPPAPTAEPDESPPFARLTPEGEFEWKYLICLLGLPVEIDPPPLQRRPWVTWTVAALVAMVSMAAGPQAQAALAWAFVPAEMWRYGGATLVTSFFLHGSLWHLVGNMYFLVALGDNVEDLVGGVRYLGLLLAGTMAGNLLHAALDPSSRVPAIGASGGIAAVILYYGLLFPHGRLRLFKFMLLVDLSVWAALVLWVVVQLVGTFVQASYPTEVSYAAHLGGALAGLIFWSVSGRGEIARVLDVRG